MTARLDSIRFTIPQHIVWRSGDGEMVLFDSRTNRYHALNPVGSVIWRQIAQGASEQDIVRSLANRYTAPHTSIAEALASFLGDAIRLGLLEEAKQGTTE